jgi:hypothetical protein
MQDGQRLLLNFRDTLKTTIGFLHSLILEKNKKKSQPPNEARRAGEGLTALFLEATYCCSSVRWHIVQDVFDGLAPSDFTAPPCRHDAKPSDLEEHVPDEQRPLTKNIVNIVLMLDLLCLALFGHAEGGILR